MFVRNPAEYLLIVPEHQSIEMRTIESLSLMRLHPDVSIPEGYKLVEELHGRSVYDEDGTLRGRYTALKRWRDKRKLESTDDKRTSNNVMRHKYRELNPLEKGQMEMVKDLSLTLYDYIDSIGKSRELSIAKTKVEEATMWAVKHITN